MTKSNEDDTDATGIGAGEEHADGCVEDFDLDEVEATQDVELPPARGGVERPGPTQS